MLSWSMQGSCERTLTCVWRLNPGLNPSLGLEASPGSLSRTGSPRRPRRRLENENEEEETRVTLSLHSIKLLIWPNQWVSLVHIFLQLVVFLCFLCLFCHTSFTVRSFCESNQISENIYDLETPHRCLISPNRPPTASRPSLHMFK